jgi:hypothetical protein
MIYLASVITRKPELRKKLRPHTKARRNRSIIIDFSIRKHYTLILVPEEKTFIPVGLSLQPPKNITVLNLEIISLDRKISPVLEIIAAKLVPVWL